MRRHHHALLILAIALLSGPAAAVGFGRSQPIATLGQALDFVVGVRLEAGEVLLPECVSAEVIVGDTALARGAVGASLESIGGATQVRVRTLAPVDEPVVSVTVNLGCESRVSRRFTLFADPPGMNPLMPAVADVPPAALAPAPLPAPPPAAPATAPPPAAADVARTPPPPAPAVRQSKLSSPAADAGKPSPRPPRKTANAPPPAAPTGSAAARPRLRLDAPIITAAAAVAAAASAAEREAALKQAEQTAIVAQAAASQATDRMAAMERDLAALRKEAQASREMITRLSATLAEADDRGRWTPMLLAAVLALAGLAIWQATKLRRERAARDAGWWAAAQQAGAAPAASASATAAETAAATSSPATALQPVSKSVDFALPAVAGVPREEVTIALAPARRSASSTPPGQPARSAEEVSAQSMQRTVPMPVATTVHIAPASRDVSIEELLDLEQQAEFFIVLGQDDAAIDLLVGHLRSSGGTVPLPYLKLMEIYRRLGDEAAYERTRDRFNHRFNAVAPGWDTDAQAVDRSLVEYPEVMAQIERNWPEPVDAMATLETQLFRSDGSEMFDLPAYREVLFLYSLARDLLEQSDRNGARVDVLLPLSDGTAYDSTQARPYLSEVSDALGSSGLDIVVEDRPTSPVDLDLDAGPKNAVSDFGFFEELRPPNKSG